MIPDTGAPLDPVGPSGTDLLILAQDQKTPKEVLEQVLEHPGLSPVVVTALLRHPQTPGAALARLSERASGPLLDVLLGSVEHLGRWVKALEALLRNPAVPVALVPAVRRQIEAVRKREADNAKKTLLLRIKELPVGEKLILAKKGNKDVRMILIKDINETVALEVAMSPRISEGEILAVAQMRDVSDKVLRFIASNRKYRVNRQIVLALLHNPRTPVGVSLSLGLHTLSDRELSDLAKDRNVPVTLSRAARQLLDRRKGLMVTRAEAER